MAWTVSRTPSVFGNKRAVLLKLTADAATQTVESGLSVIEGMALGAASMTTLNARVWPNSNASGVQSNGVLGCSGFVSGDILYVTVFGR